MPRIFDNIDQQLLPALRRTMELSFRSDFCVGYFNLRGWRSVADIVQEWPGGDGQCCRLLVGMQRLPREDLRAALTVTDGDEPVDQQTALRLRKQIAREFRDQLTIGAPSNVDEASLRQLVAQLKAGKLVVKLFLRHSLHAKLYLLFRNDFNAPIVGYLGSSNLTLSGLSHQGELNVDIMDGDASAKLAQWFEDRWNDRFCLDITKDLIAAIEESWAREDLIPPYQIYVKMAYHLSQDAREGLLQFRVPRDFGNTLFPFQTAAVKIAAHHVNKRGGVLLGDVVGLGKTLMATALARLLEDDQDLETLILCPKNLVAMWEKYRERYRLRGRVLSITRAQQQLPELRRYRLVIVDESHNLRNREGARYQAIKTYIQENQSRCILLSATPYNKTYLDLANQLRLFLPEDQDLGIRPDALLANITPTELTARYQISPSCLAAFEKSPYADDWRELMRLYMVRRTRSFVRDNYAEFDPERNRSYLQFPDGTRSYFPDRIPRTVRFQVRDEDPTDQYAALFHPDVVDLVNRLSLPRYGLGLYVAPKPEAPPTQREADVIGNLSRAGQRLMGFCRTNLFKRLESGGDAFLLSVERHILRNYIFLHAIENGEPLPIGKQGVELFDSRFNDTDRETEQEDIFDEETDTETAVSQDGLRTPEQFRERAEQIYRLYRTQFRNRFSWLNPTLFVQDLRANLASDADALQSIFERVNQWDAAQDKKLSALKRLLAEIHPNEKLLVFTQFADTVRYLERQLANAGFGKVVGVTGDDDNPTAVAWRFSPVSNDARNTVALEDEIRVLLTTDVLSEGQNLQDAAIVVNYDLPWAIIRLIQRAGRVDRIGQKSDQILCYTFLPADGVERIIRLRGRVRQRLRENAEVVGTDETFFEDDQNDAAIANLYNESAGVLDGDDEGEIDLASYAYQIWKEATERDPSLLRSIPAMPNVVYSSKGAESDESATPGVLVYLKSASDNDTLAWMSASGQLVTESQLAILKAAACPPEEPAVLRQNNHHELVTSALRHVAEQEKAVGGSLGSRSSIRYRLYHLLLAHQDETKGTIFENAEVKRAIDEVYKYPLYESAKEAIGRQMRTGASRSAIVEMVLNLRDKNRLCNINDDAADADPRIICSLGLVRQEGD